MDIVLVQQSELFLSITVCGSRKQWRTHTRAPALPVSTLPVSLWTLHIADVPIMCCLVTHFAWVLWAHRTAYRPVLGLLDLLCVLFGPWEYKMITAYV